MFSEIKNTITKFIKHPTFLNFYLPSFLVAFAWGVRSPVLPLYGSELSGVYLLIGLISAGGGLGTMITDLPIGRYIQNIDKRHTMIAGIGMDALSTLALVWVDSIWVAIGLRIIGGVGHAVFSIARHTYITNAIRINARGRAISLLGGILRTGLFLGPAVGGMVGEKFGIRLPFAAYALISFIAISVILLSKKPASEEVQSQKNASKNVVNLREALKGRWGIFSIASLSYILAQIAVAGESLIIPLWGSEVLKLSADRIGWVMSLSSAVSLILFFPAGTIMDRWGRKLALVPSFLLIGLGLGLLPLTGGFWGLATVGMVIGLGHGFGSGAMLTLGSDLSPKLGRSAFLGAWQWIADIGSSSGPLLVGLVADILALPFASLAVASAGLLAGGVIALFVPETLNWKEGGNQEEDQFS
jgi:MFS family permease